MQPLLIIGIAQGLFASAYFLLKRPRVLSDLIVSVFMLFLTLPLGLKLLNFYVHADGIFFAALFSALPFTHGPFLFLYTMAEISEHAMLRARYALHFLPFIAVLIAAMCLPLSLPNELSRVRPRQEAAVRDMRPGDDARKMPPPREPAYGTLADDPGMPRMRPRDDGRRVNIPWLAAFSLLSLSYLGYSIGILRMLSRHRRTIGDYFSSRSNTTTLQWLAWTAAAFLITGIFTGVFSMLVPSLIAFRGIPPGIADAYGLTFFIFVFGMFSVKQPQLFVRTHAPSAEQDTAAETGEAPRYERSGLSAEDAVRYRKALETYMAEEKAYRNSELTIVDVADALSIRRHHLTQVMNEQLKMNFYTYINKLRLAEVIEHIEGGADGESLLVIAFDAGFNSKSTFNRVFKDLTGMTPSQYRERKGAA